MLTLPSGNGGQIVNYTVINMYEYGCLLGVAPSTLVGSEQRFTGAHCHHHQEAVTSP